MAVLKEDKGLEGGSCNRAACQRPKAVYFNTGTQKFYCKACALLIHRANPDYKLFPDLIRKPNQ